MTFDDLAAMKRVGAPQVSPDGKSVAYDVSTIDLAKNVRKSAIYLVSSAGGASRQISEGSKQDEGPVWSPDGKTIAYVSNREAAAKQIYLYDVSSGASRKISDLPGGAENIRWRPDGSGLFAVSDFDLDCGIALECLQDKKRDEASKPGNARIITNLLYRHWNAWQEPRTRSHILWVPLGGSPIGTSPRDLTPGAFDAPPFSVGGGDEFDLSPDGKELVYARNTDPHPELSTNSDIFLVSMTGESAKRITTRTGADTSPRYSPDGRWIAWRSQARAGYESDLWELWLYDRKNGTTRRLAPSFDNWIESIAWAPDSKSLFVTAPEKSKVAIFEVDVKSGNITPVWSEGSAGAVTISKDGKTIYFDRSTLSSPNEIWQMPRGGKATPLTHENDALLSSMIMGTASDLWYAGADGTNVQALLLKPPAFDPSKRYPAIVLIHGGPQGAWDDQWSYRWNAQLFASRGYVILMPNPRGSTGYGQKFVEEISGDWGGRVYTDIMNGVDQLAAMPFVESTRIGAAGASFGGYMIDWILGHTDRFKAVVTHDGVYDLVSMYGVTEELWFPEWEFHGNPWDNPELYQKWSPSNFVKNFKTPTLVVQGERDFRVPANQGLELFTALQRRDVPSKLLYFTDEGHWVLKPQDSKVWYQTVQDWLDQWVKK